MRKLQITDYELRNNSGFRIRDSGNSSRIQHSESRIILGALGENYAAHYLQACGYTIVETNWQSGHREIDLIAFSDMPEKQWLFVEVKSGQEDGDPRQHFTKRKQADFSYAIEHYLEKHHLWEKSFQADLVCIEVDKKDTIVSLDHYPDVI